MAIHEDDTATGESMLRDAIDYPITSDHTAISTVIGGTLSLLVAVVAIEHQRLVTWLFAGDSNPFLFGATLLLLCISIASTFLVFGYLTHVLAHTSGGQSDLPRFLDRSLNKLLTDGFRAFLIVGGYLVPPFALWFFSDSAMTAKWFSPEIQDLLRTFGHSIAVFGMLMAIYVVPAALTHFSRQKWNKSGGNQDVTRTNVGAGFSLEKFLPVLKSGQYAVRWLEVLLALVVVAFLDVLLLYVPYVGWIAASFVNFFALIFVCYLYGRTYSDVTSQSAWRERNISAESERAWYYDGTGVFLAFLFLLLAFVTMRASVTGDLTIVGIPFLPDVARPYFDPGYWLATDEGPWLKTSVPFNVYFYGFVGALGYIFLSFVTNPDDDLEQDAKDILLRLKKWTGNDEKSTTAKKLLVEIQAWSSAGELPETDPELIMDKIGRWSPDEQDALRSAELILGSIEAWKSPSNGATPAPDESGEDQDNATIAENVLNSLENTRLPSSADKQTPAQSIVAAIRNWSVEDAETLSSQEKKRVSEGKSLLSKPTPPIPLSELKERGILTANQAKKLAKNGISTDLELRMMRGKLDDIFEDETTGKIISDAVEAERKKEEGSQWFKELVEQGVISKKQRKTFQNAGVASPLQLLREHRPVLEKAHNANQIEQAIEGQAGTVGAPQGRINPRPTANHLDRTTLEMWKFGFRIPAALLLAAGVSLLFFEPTEELRIVAGTSFLIGLAVKPAYRIIGDFADRLLSGGHSEEVAGPVVWATETITNKTWYRNSIGVLLVLTYLVLSVGTVFFSIEENPETLFSLELPEYALVPFEVYFYALFGALTYVFTSLLNDFDKDTKSLLQAGLRIPAALLLVAGVYALGDYFLGTETVGVLPELAFIVGLYVRLTLQKLGELTDDLSTRLS